MGFWKHGFMQEEADSILYQRRQNVWSKKSIYTLKFLPKHMKQTEKCHALWHFRYTWSWKTPKPYMLGGVPIFARVRLCVCVCVCVCKCVWCPSLHCGFTSRQFGGFFVFLHDKHKTEPLGRNWYISLIVRLTTRDASHIHEADVLWRNWYTLSKHLGMKLVRFLGRGTQLVRPLGKIQKMRIIQSYVRSNPESILTCVPPMRELVSSP